MSSRRYDDAGVAGQSDALASVKRHLGPTLAAAKLLTGFGTYASVIQLTDELAVAISTDGVGSKTIVAAALNRYDTIGFDCVAMNVNDVLCVGARPIAMVDYLGVHTLEAGRADAILEGLGAAAKEAGIAIPGGELAQLPEIIGTGSAGPLRESGSNGAAPGDPSAFDLVGTCIGTVRPDEVILGNDVRPGDAIIGIASSGIHSNGLTLARRTLVGEGQYSYEDFVAELGTTVGAELLRPTTIYAGAVSALWDAGIQTSGLAHITSDGLCNLCRLGAPVGYRVERLWAPPVIFGLIGDAGSIEDAEMFRVFNMGVGFVVIVPADQAPQAITVIESAGHDAMRLGAVTDETGVVRIEPAGLIGRLERGASSFEPA